MLEVAIRTTVLLADDHAVVREGLRAMLEGDPNLEIVGEAANGAEAVQMARSLEPRIVLMDVKMPQMDGLEATQRIKALQPGITVIILTMYENEAFVVRAIQAGASSYLLKDAPKAQVLGAIHAAAQGEALMTSELLRSAVSHLSNPKATVMESVPERYIAPESLTPRELETLAYVAQGLTNKEIAGRLEVSPETVKKSVQTIIEKMQASDRTHAAVKAIRMGMLV